MVCDNCADGMEEVAGALPVRVIRSVGNRHRRAGALNQTLEQLLRELRPDDAVLVMDADSVLEPGLLSCATARLGTARRSLPGPDEGCCCG